MAGVELCLAVAGSRDADDIDLLRADQAIHRLQRGEGRGTQPVRAGSYGCKDARHLEVAGLRGAAALSDRDAKVIPHSGADRSGERLPDEDLSGPELFASVLRPLHEVEAAEVWLGHRVEADDPNEGVGRPAVKVGHRPDELDASLNSGC